MTEFFALPSSFQEQVAPLAALLLASLFLVGSTVGTSWWPFWVSLGLLSCPAAVALLAGWPSS